MQDSKDKTLSEELLRAWLRLSLDIINERLVSEMPYKEALICSLLYRNPDKRYTATDLCAETKTLKSQMNRTLNSMEEKKLIRRERSTQDKRQVFITLDTEQADLYKRQHAKILQLVDTVIEKFGKEKTTEIIEMLKEISGVVKEVL